MEVNQGFPSMRADIESKDAVFVIPSFTFGEQLSKEEITETFKIASVDLRIHIERCIQSIKIDRILSFLPSELRVQADKIIRLCCSLVNLQPPIIKLNN